MDKTYINVPLGTKHLSDCSSYLQSQFPQQSFLLNKRLTGCGATTMFLSDSTPTILCSPRLELIHCKVNSPEFKGRLHQFRDGDDRKSSVLELQDQMMDYIWRSALVNPYSDIIPKILVTYDSWKHVAQRLQGEGLLSQFRIVIDEAQSIIGDAAFKGDVEIEFLENLNHSNRVIYLSATPYLETYLDQISYFQNLPYVDLIWDKSAFHSANIVKSPYYRGSILETVGQIIQRYRSNGYFERKIVNGLEVQAKEAVFFLNDVKKVAQIIKRNNLTPVDTNVICARTDENAKKLSSVGFTIGHVPQFGEQNFPITIATRCSFEGVDFYSDCAYTYIFSDISLKHLDLDVSQDVPQILGRQRLESNPFRYDATFYYKTFNELHGINDQEFQEMIKKKVALTDEWIDKYKTGSKAFQDSMARMFRSTGSGQENQDTFVAIVDDQVSGARDARLNELALCNEIRAWEIQRSQYYSDCQVLSVIDETTKTPADDPKIKAFLDSFQGCFEQRLKAYCEFISAYPDYLEILDQLPQIPMEMKQYFRNPGPDIIRSCSYIEAKIIRSLSLESNIEQLKRKTLDTFKKGNFYSYKQIKTLLTKIYNDLGIEKNAKACDLLDMDWLTCKVAKNKMDGRWENGYKIL